MTLFYNKKKVVENKKIRDNYGHSDNKSDEIKKYIREV